MERFSFRRVTRSSCTLQKQSFLALDVALNPVHEGPHGRVVTTPWRSSATILTLFNVFEITIDNSLFALTTSTEYDIRGCLDDFY